MSDFPSDPTGAHEVAPPPEADETNEPEAAREHPDTAGDEE